jgi:hypothetical protein
MASIYNYYCTYFRDRGCHVALALHHIICLLHISVRRQKLMALSAKHKVFGRRNTILLFVR